MDKVQQVNSLSRLRCKVRKIDEIPANTPLGTMYRSVVRCLVTDPPHVAGLMLCIYYPENSQLPAIGVMGTATHEGKWVFSPDLETI